MWWRKHDERNVFLDSQGSWILGPANGLSGIYLLVSYRLHQQLVDLQPNPCLRRSGQPNSNHDGYIYFKLAMVRKDEENVT